MHVYLYVYNYVLCHISVEFSVWILSMKNKENVVAVAQGHKRAIMYVTVVGWIPTWANDIFLFSRSSKAKHGVEFQYSGK